MGQRPRTAIRTSALVQRRILAIALLLAGLMTIGFGAPAMAQTRSNTSKASTSNATKSDAGAKPDKMFVEANELVYNSNNDTVAAQGNARVYYQGRVLEADKVIYDRKTNRVFAEGNAKLTERDGTIVHADRFDLTEDFRDGFIESVRADTTDKTHFSAPRVERIEGDTTVFEKGSYTACDVCKDDPQKPPLWRVHGKRIIHKNDEQMIYYEDASLEFLGIPVAYLPFFSTPDPEVKRKSGILSPHLLYHSQLGAGFGLPIFWALAPNYDLTVTPTAFSKQGFFGAAEFRHRLADGEYYVRATGIPQANKSLFLPPPYGASNEVFRGSIDTKGQFQIADQWKAGWALTLLSDKYYLNDYSIPSQTLSANYFSETTSTAYVTGQGDRSFFDLRGFHFEGLSTHDIQKQQANALPVLDYNRTFDVDPAKSAGLGGQVELDFNFTNLTAQQASYQSVGPRQLDSAYGLYDVCRTYLPGTTNNSCLLRGIAGDTSRATATATYKRKFIDPIGEVWTPFAFARVEGQSLQLNTSNSTTFASSTGGVSTISNGSQTAFTGGASNATYGNVTPGVGIEYRYPFFAKTRIGSFVVEPIAQVIARPDQIGTRSLVNLDAQSLVFDETNLFQYDKFSGYDRFETGLRTNYGGQATFTANNGAYANVIVGQSYQIAGANAYATADAANVGLSSGLDTRRSDTVGAFTVSPGSFLSFTAKGRFDATSWQPRRIDLITSMNFGALTANIQYARYDAQPLIGYDVRREGISLQGKYKLTENYFVQGNVVFDMSRHLYPANIIGYSSPGLFSPATFGVGVGYQDECTTLTGTYSSIFYDNGSGSLSHNQTFLLQLQLRTLGDARTTQTASTTDAGGTTAASTK